MNGIDSVRRPRELQVLFGRVSKKGAVLLGDLAGVGDNPKVVQRALSPIAIRKHAGQVGGQTGRQLLPGSPLALVGFPFAGQKTLQRQAGLDRGELLRLALNNPHKAPLDEAVEDFINLLARDAGRSGDFQGFESRMPNQNKVSSRFIRVQADLLESAGFGFEIHSYQVITRRGSARS